MNVAQGRSSIRPEKQLMGAELTDRMLEIVARDVHEWADRKVPIGHIGINVSLADFHGGRLDQQIAAAQP